MEKKDINLLGTNIKYIEQGEGKPVVILHGWGANIESIMPIVNSMPKGYKIYAYAAVGGLLWSNWCEYKQSLGLDFGEYSLSQYRYAKEYSKLVLNYLEEKNA